MASVGKRMSQKYVLAKFFGAAEEFAFQLLEHRQQMVAKNMSWNPSEAISSAVTKFQVTWNKQLTTTMYLAGGAMTPGLNSRSKEDQSAVERLVVRLIPRPTAAKVLIGDVVALRSPLAALSDEQHVMVRRVAALEGSEMVSDNEEDEGFEIPKGHCWVLADNVDLKPPEVIDSRTFGFIPMDSIIGRVIYSATSATEHGPVLNNAVSVANDRAVCEQEVDVEQLFTTASKDGESDK